MHEKVHAKHCKKITWKVNTVCQPNLGSLCHAIKIYIYIYIYIYIKISLVQSFLTDISLLIVPLFEKRSILCFTKKN